jgi:hypothetical protein
MRNLTIGSLLIISLCALTPAQQLQISPQSLCFKNQLLNVASPAQTATLTNTGTTNVTLNSIAASGTYSAVSQCSTLAAGESCTVDVTFTPDALGTTNGAVTITSSAQSAPQTVGLTGTAIPPMRLTPAALSFGAVPVGSASQPQAVTVTNQRSTSITLETIATTGNYSQSNNCPASLAAGKNCAVSVTFRPTAATAIPGALSLITADGTDPSVALSGSGSGSVVSHVSLSASSMDFGNETLGASTPMKTVTLTNTSTTSLTFQSVSVSIPYRMEERQPSCTGMLPPGGQCIFAVWFAPSIAAGPARYPGAVTIVDSDASSPQVIGLSGKGALEVLFSPHALHFPTQEVGTTSAPVIVTVTNTMQQPENLITGIFATGDFTVVGVGTKTTPCFDLLIFSGSCTVAVTFTPTRTGAITGAVTFNDYPLCKLDSACAESAVLSLTGTGD